MIQFVFNPTDKLVSYFTELRPFEGVLPDESVRVLISITFPRMVRLTEIERNMYFFAIF